ncbi:MAG: family transcriptional regulator [Conexibacter sp.]|nr:family transcriptional regulator [Conexibacter sp.]
MPVLDPHRVTDEATRLDVAEIAAYLQAQLGQKLTAYVAGVTDPKMVGRWAAGKARPRDEREMRLRDAFKATRMLVAAFDAGTAKAWWVGSNTRLDDRAPAAIVRHAVDPEALRYVVPAARAFAGGPA